MLLRASQGRSGKPKGEMSWDSYYDLEGVRKMQNSANWYQFVQDSLVDYSMARKCGEKISETGQILGHWQDAWKSGNKGRDNRTPQMEQEKCNAAWLS